MSVEQVGRVAMRAEGEMWNAYYALPDSMSDAIPLGSIRLASVRDNPARKQAFIEMMREIVGDILEEQTGVRPTWDIKPAPEHERAGNG